MSRGVRERVADRALGDLAEGHPLGLRRRDVRGLGDVPGDRLALAVEVGREEHGVGRLRRLRDLGDLLLAVVGDDVLRGEVMVDVHAELALAGVLRAGRGRGRRRRGRGSRRRDSARSSAPWQATPRSQGSSARPGVYHRDSALRSPVDRRVSAAGPRRPLRNRSPMPEGSSATRSARGARPRGSAAGSPRRARDPRPPRRRRSGPLPPRRARRPARPRPPTAGSR